jgi:hypothetical protein
MLKPIAALLAVLPSAAFAGPIYVEYEGVVTALLGCGCNPSGYEVGDTIQGVVTIHMDRAPRDSHPSPTGGQYGNEAPDFLSGFGAPFTRETPYPFDFITVYDDLPDTGDYWQISDQFQPARGRGGLSLYAQSETLDFVHGDAMLQNVDLTPSPGLTLGGFLGYTWKGSAGNWAIVAFDLLKLKQRPRSCHAT